MTTAKSDAHLSYAQAQTTRVFVFDENSPPYSYRDPQGKLVGLFPDLVQLAAQEWPGVTVTLRAAPWARAQEMVRSGLADGFLTYPSEDRKTYARIKLNTLVQWQKVDFHLGLRQDLARGQAYLDSLDRALRGKEFPKNLRELLARYRPRPRQTRARLSG